MAFTIENPGQRLRVLLRRTTAVVICGAMLGQVTPALAEPVNPDEDSMQRAREDVAEDTAAVSALAGQISSFQEEINRLELEIGGLREGVNKALVDLHDARAVAEQSRQAVLAARAQLDSTQDEIDVAQERLNEISRATYRNGAKNGAVTAAAGGDSAEDALDRQTYLRTHAQKRRSAIIELDELRTRQANEESVLRQARNLAEEREAVATQTKLDAERQVGEATEQLQGRTAERDRLVGERDQAQAQLNRSRENAGQLEQQRREYREHRAAEATRREAEATAAEAAREKMAAEAAAVQAEAEVRAREETPEAPVDAQPSEPAPDAAPAPVEETTEDTGKSDRDAAAAAERARQEADEAAEREARTAQIRDAAVVAAAAAAAALIAQNTAEHTNLDNPYPSGEDSPEVPIAAVENPTAEPEDTTTEEATDPAEVVLEPLPTTASITEQAQEEVSGSREELIELAISRATAQVGTSYAWGGGTANGPSQGIRDGGVADSHGDYGKVGFDCSGLVLYAFAGAGVALPHYTGYQYNHGTRIDPGQMERGDLIFYGPNGDSHVAIYLGDGIMVEAPQSGGAVQITEVRWSGMSPSAVRLI